MKSLAHALLVVTVMAATATLTSPAWARGNSGGNGGHTFANVKSAPATIAFQPMNLARSYNTANLPNVGPHYTVPNATFAQKRLPIQNGSNFRDKDSNHDKFHDKSWYDCHFGYCYFPSCGYGYYPYPNYGYDVPYGAASNPASPQIDSGGFGMPNPPYASGVIENPPAPIISYEDGGIMETLPATYADATTDIGVAVDAGPAVIDPATTNLGPAMTGPAVADFGKGAGAEPAIVGPATTNLGVAGGLNVANPGVATNGTPVTDPRAAMNTATAGAGMTTNLAPATGPAAIVAPPSGNPALAPADAANRDTQASPNGDTQRVPEKT